MKQISPVIIQTRFDLCTGCRLCQMACSFHHLDGYNPRRSRLRIEDRSENLYHFPVVCNQCENPYCANVCPVNAIERDPKTSALVVDQERCIGCGLCIRYCPVEMIHLDPVLEKAVKCNLCNGIPECVSACPTSALILVIKEDKT